MVSATKEPQEKTDLMIVLEEVSSLRVTLFNHQTAWRKRAEAIEVGLADAIALLESVERGQAMILAWMQGNAPPTTPADPMAETLPDCPAAEIEQRQIEIQVKAALVKACRPLKISSISRQLGKEEPTDYLRKAVYAMHRRGDISRDEENRYFVAKS